MEFVSSPFLSYLHRFMHYQEPSPMHMQVSDHPWHCKLGLNFQTLLLPANSLFQFNCYIQTKTSHSERCNKFYSFLYIRQALNFRNQKNALYFLPNRCVPPERNSNFSFLCASHQFWGRKETLKIPLSGRKSVAHLCISNNRLLKITNLNYIVFLTL